MTKNIKKIWIIPILTLALTLAVCCGAVLGLTGCKDKAPTPQDTKSATAYGVFHKDYAGKADITVAKYSDGTYMVTDIKLDEYLPVASIGTVGDGGKINGVDIDPNDFVEFANGTTTSYKAKWVKVGDSVFTFNEESKLYESDRLPAGKTFARGENNAYGDTDFTRWYIERMAAGDFYVCKDAEGTEVYDIPFNVGQDGGVVQKGDWASKRLNGYWPAGVPNGLGWQVNIAAIEAAIRAYGLEVYTGNEVADNNFYRLGENVTGATLVDYHSYLRVANNAYQSAKSELAGQ